MDKNKKYNLAGTKTEQCLKAAFAGESEARNKYTYYAAKAKKDKTSNIGSSTYRAVNLGKELVSKLILYIKIYFFLREY